MPEAFNKKDERQYARVKQSELDRGLSVARAEEIAARTVNKQRNKEGRTPNVRTQGTGNPFTALEDRTVDQLKNRARQLDVPGRSEMTKDELIGAIRSRQ